LIPAVLVVFITTLLTFGVLPRKPGVVICFGRVLLLALQSLAAGLGRLSQP